MSMSARQERILARMAHSLHASEPRLTSMFAIFTRLTRDEDMPGLRQAISGAAAAYAPGARLRTILLVPKRAAPRR
jgi:hypothetical protein